MSHSQIRSEEQIEAWGDEYMRLNAAYDLLDRYQVSFAMFLAKPWYYRVFTELLEDAVSIRPQGELLPPLPEQRELRKKIDRGHLRPESRRRLHNGAIFEPLHHHRHPRRGLTPFFRKRP